MHGEYKGVKQSDHSGSEQVSPSVEAWGRISSQLLQLNNLNNSEHASNASPSAAAAEEEPLVGEQLAGVSGGHYNEDDLRALEMQFRYGFTVIG